MTTISTPRFALLQGETTCYKCRARVPVAGLAASPEARVDDEEYSLVSGEHGWLGLSEIEALSAEVLQLLRERAPGYRADDSVTADLRYLMNHCECGAKLGDFFLHGKPDGPFFGLETDGLRAWLIERPLRVEASYSEGALDEWLHKSFSVSG